jgi:hypothetical protein
MAWTDPRDWVNDYTVGDTDLDEISENLRQVVRVLDRDVTATVVTNTITETSVYSVSVPANTLGTFRRIRLFMRGEFTNSSGGNSTPTLKLKFGGTTIATFAPVLSSSATSRLWTLLANIIAENATNAQRADAESKVSTPIANGTAGTLAANEVVQHNGLALDSTGALTLELTIQHDGISTSRSFTAHAVFAELMPAA